MAARGLRVDGLTLGYGRRTVINDLSLEVGVGLTVLLGPNGAGKTTLLEAIGALAKPCLEHVSIDSLRVTGASRSDALSRIGFVAQYDDLIPAFRVDEFLRYAGWLKDVVAGESTTKVEIALRAVGMWNERRTRISRLSGGMRQRVSLAASFVHNPTVWILDEPTVGLDPEQRALFRSLLRERAQSATVIMSTHLVDDIPNFDVRCLVLAEGAMRFSGTRSELEARAEPLSADVSALESGYISVVNAADTADTAGADG